MQILLMALHRKGFSRVKTTFATHVQNSVEHISRLGIFMAMFAKIFEQIFDSSIAENYSTRHVFMDLLVLADSEGAVDMTVQAVARRTNVPLDIVHKALEELLSPDPSSRSSANEGRRLEPLEQGRSWGWKIINYVHYRQLLNEESRRSYFRDYRRKERASKAVESPKKRGRPKSVQNSSHKNEKFTQGDPSASSSTSALRDEVQERGGESQKPRKERISRPEAMGLIPDSLKPAAESIGLWFDGKEQMGDCYTPIGWKSLMSELASKPIGMVDASIRRTLAKGWKGIVFQDEDPFAPIRQPSSPPAAPIAAVRKNLAMPANWRELYELDRDAEYLSKRPEGLRTDENDWKDLCMFDFQTARDIVARAMAKS